MLALTLTMSNTAQAIPLLTFQGTFSYTQTTGMFEADGMLTGYDMLSSAPVIGGSSFSMHATFLSSATSSPAVIGLFDTAAGVSDFSVVDGGGSLLLEAELADVVLTGVLGFGLGSVQANLLPTGGSLAGDFAASPNLLAFTFGLSSPFSTNSFDDDFDGTLSGRVEAAAVAVAEPAMAWLLAGGMLALLWVRVPHHGGRPARAGA